MTATKFRFEAISRVGSFRVAHAGALKEIAWHDYTISMPVVLSYCAIKLLSGRAKEVHVMLYVVAALLIVRYIWLAG